MAKGREPGPGGKRAAYHHGGLRRALLDAALELLREQGAHAVSLRELARRIGVTYGAPFHHFAEKDDLFAALATEAFEALEGAIAARLAQLEATDVASVLRAVGDGYLTFAREDPARYEVMFLPQLRDRARFVELHATGGRSLARLTELLQHGEGLDATAARARAVACWSSLHGFAVLSNAGFLDDEASTGDLAATREAILDGLAARP